MPSYRIGSSSAWALETLVDSVILDFQVGSDPDPVCTGLKSWTGGARLLSADPL